VFFEVCGVAGTDILPSVFSEVNVAIPETGSNDDPLAINDGYGNRLFTSVAFELPLIQNFER
jgi:hypothetical protein